MATKPSNELTAAKRAAEEAESSAMKKQKVDEEDDGSSDSSSGNESGVNEWLKYKLLPAREPEWDVDSFDGREFKMYPRARKLSPNQELYDKYYNERLKAFESKGFLPDIADGIYEYNLDAPMKPYNTAREFLADLANVCVKKFNETKGKTLELVNVVRATESGVGKSKLYITFMAREFANGPLVEYQAKVIKFFKDEKPPFPILCRPSPKPEI